MDTPVIRPYLNASPAAWRLTRRWLFDSALAYVFLLALLSLWPSLRPQLCQWDAEAMQLLNYQGSAFADRFWFAYSHLRTWLPLAAVLLCSLCLRERGHWRQLAVYLLALVLLLVVADQLSSGLIKPLAGRLRPSHDPALSGLLHYVNGYRGGLYGFVSGHATNIFALTTWLSFYFRSRLTRAVLLLFAVGMCYSRIYLGVHYPGDVVCGAMLGYALARAARCLLSRHFRLPYTTKAACELPLAMIVSTLLYI